MRFSSKLDGRQARDGAQSLNAAKTFMEWFLLPIHERNMARILLNSGNLSKRFKFRGER